MSRIILGLFFIGGFLLLSVYPQITKEQADKVFAEIPAEQRAKLVERLNLFIELEKTGKFDESYKMIAESFKDMVRGGFDIKDYEESPKVKRFLPQSLTVMSEDTIYAAVPVKIDKLAVFIDGCGEFKSNSGKVKTVFEAYWENNDWYFSFLQVVGFQPIKCKYKTKEKNNFFDLSIELKKSITKQKEFKKMAETLVEEKVEEKAIQETPQERLERLLRENNIKVFTAEDFDIPKDEETQAKIRAEVDEFLRMREEDRKLSFEREKEREKLWQ